MSTVPGEMEGVDRKDHTDDTETIGVSADTTALAMPTVSATTSCAMTSRSLIGVLSSLVLGWYRVRR